MSESIAENCRFRTWLWIEKHERELFISPKLIKNFSAKRWKRSNFAECKVANYAKCENALQHSILWPHLRKLSLPQHVKLSVEIST